MSKYRIYVTHSEYKNSPTFWPQVKGWFGWSNISGGWSSEEGARNSIEGHRSKDYVIEIEER